MLAKDDFYTTFLTGLLVHNQFFYGFNCMTFRELWDIIGSWVSQERHRSFLYLDSEKKLSDREGEKTHRMKTMNRYSNIRLALITSISRPSVITIVANEPTVYRLASD